MCIKDTNDSKNKELDDELELKNKTMVTYGFQKKFKKTHRTKKQILRQKADDSIFMNYVDCRGNIEFEKIFVDAGILVFALARVKGKRRIRWRDRKSEIRNIFVLVDWDRSRESGENS